MIWGMMMACFVLAVVVTAAGTEGEMERCIRACKDVCQDGWGSVKEPVIVACFGACGRIAEIYAAKAGVLPVQW